MTTDLFAFETTCSLLLITTYPAHNTLTISTFPYLLAKLSESHLNMADTTKYEAVHEDSIDTEATLADTPSTTTQPITSTASMSRGAVFLLLGTAVLTTWGGLAAITV